MFVAQAPGDLPKKILKKYDSLLLIPGMTLNRARFASSTSPQRKNKKQRQSTNQASVADLIAMKKSELIDKVTAI